MVWGRYKMFAGRCQMVSVRFQMVFILFIMFIMFIMFLGIIMFMMFLMFMMCILFHLLSPVI